MKKMFMAVIALMMTISASAQFYIYYSDGTVAKVDSISMVAPGDSEKLDHSTGIGVFSVGEGKTVTFSKGNLQYIQSTNTWSFAENQWDYLGEANIAIDADVLADKVDLFGWSTNSTNFGVSTSTNSDDYAGTFVDWGANLIGADSPNTWRTLTLDEWIYVAFRRSNAESFKGVAQVNGVNGLILLPDNWVCPSDVTFKSGFHMAFGVDYYAAYQTFTTVQWSKLEAAGAVFLPAAGYRLGIDINFVQNYCYYWSATENDINSADCLGFNSSGSIAGGSYRHDAKSVRLVKDVENTGTIDTPEEPKEPENPSVSTGAFSVAKGKQVAFSKGNLQYTQSTKMWSFASAQYEMIGTNNVTGNGGYSDQYGDTKVGIALADKIDLFGWSTSANCFGVSASIDNDDYAGFFVDWGSNKIGDDAPNTWRTLTYDEWDYLLYTRDKANSLYGVAQVNGVNGIILLPDNWTCPLGITFISGFHSNHGVDYYAVYQTFTIAQWSLLEAAGAIFLPVAGFRWGMDTCNVRGFGRCWSASESNNDSANYLYFDSGGAGMNNGYRGSGLSVRLVKDL